MRRATRYSVLLAAVAFAPWIGSCTNDEIGVACEDACGMAQHCGLLPSPLGAETDHVEAEDNCRRRCELSDKDTRESIASCLKRENISDPQDDWCGADAGRHPCADAAACLVSHFGSEAILGRVEVNVVAVTDAGPECPDDPVTEDPNDSICRPEPCSQEACDEGKTVECDCTSCEELMTAAKASDICSGINAYAARYFLTRKGTYYRFAEQGCLEGLSDIGATLDLPPGPLRAGVEVRGAYEADTDAPPDAGPSDVEGESYCRVFYGPELVLPAGASYEIPIPIPELTDVDDWPNVCEDSAPLCGDGEDNDGDGLEDCADPDCALSCEEEADQPDEALMRIVDLHTNR